MIEGNIIGKRTNCMTGETEDVQLSYTIEVCFDEHSNEKTIFQLIGGPTGYEGFIIDYDAARLKEMAKKGWMACMGTKGSYDKLVIEADEMKKVLEAYQGDKVAEVCLGPMSCKKDSTYIYECCQMNGGFHTKEIEKPKGPFVFEDREGFTYIPERKE